MSLIELLTVVAIVGVLAAIAYPSYLSFAQRANRTDGQRTLQLTGQALERCYSQNFSYANAACAPLVPATSPNGYYNIAFATSGGGTDYTLTATPNGPPQSHDAPCQTLVLDAQSGPSAQDGSGNDTTQICWGSN
jgi:type IV pilus assembly protein PilE